MGRLKGKQVNMTIFQCYAPTNDTNQDANSMTLRLVWETMQRLDQITQTLKELLETMGVVA